jgi:RNA 2',3'-cyclic 3'-phosphodiesterase
MRIFVALFVPDAVRDAVVDAIESLRRPGDGVSWVKPENLHYTLRFTGALGEDGTRRVGEAVDEAARRHSPFELALGGLGCFPPKGVPRVLWTGASLGAEPLEAYARDLEQGLRGRGFDRADHPFRAHLTIGRVRDARGGPALAPSRDWREALAAVALQAPAFRVERVAVVHSQLSPKGSMYTVLRQAVLGG